MKFKLQDFNFKELNPKSDRVDNCSFIYNILPIEEIAHFLSITARR